MRFQRTFVLEQVVERTIQALLGDLCFAELQQIGKCRAAVPILGNVQLARWLAQAALTSNAAIFAQGMRSLPIGRSCSHKSSRPVTRHNASAR